MTKKGKRVSKATAETVVGWDMDNYPVPNGYDPSRLDPEFMKSLGYTESTIVAGGNDFSVFTYKANNLEFGKGKYVSPLLQMIKERQKMKNKNLEETEFFKECQKKHTNLLNNERKARLSRIEEEIRTNEKIGDRSMSETEKLSR